MRAKFLEATRGLAAESVRTVLIVHGIFCWGRDHPELRRAVAYTAKILRIEGCDLRIFEGAVGIRRIKGPILQLSQFEGSIRRMHPSIRRNRTYPSNDSKRTVLQSNPYFIMRELECSSVASKALTM